ncbi:MAG: HAMP domain-containing histidine kinase [Rhodospirillales bacterium]|nr:HAMP domain-containing histidine kinase [Rhodospirillales bacterium]
MNPFRSLRTALPIAALLCALATGLAVGLVEGPARWLLAVLAAGIAAAAAFGLSTQIERQVEAAFARALAARPDAPADAAGAFAEIADCEARYSAIAAQMRQTEHTLRVTLDDAVHANQAKAEFLANMSHELRTPLNAIIGFAEFLQIRVGKQLPERERAYLDDIIQAAFHLLAIIQEILDFSRLEAGKLMVQEDRMRLAEIVDASVRLVRKQAEAKRVSLYENLDSAVRVLGDATKIRQISTNLVTNAVKFTPSGGRVDVWCGLDAGGAPCLRVSDSGVGMTPGEVELALKPFMRVATSPFVAKEGGIGLGLPISRALVELHGGTLTIQSEPRRGTTVTVTLPAERLIVA